MRHAGWMAVALMLAGCSKRGAPPEGAADDARGQAPITAQIPDTPEARAFARRLVDTTVTGWDPVAGGAGAQFRYETLQFRPDGKFEAIAGLQADFETVECRETGEWAIDEAESETTATMNWTVVKTSCPTRQNGTSQRVLMTITPDGRYKISFR